MNKQGTRCVKEEMRPHIKDWESSGQTKRTFCKERGITLSVFYYWFKKYNEETQPGGFVPLDFDVAPTSADVVEIKYPNGVTLRLPPGTSSSAIRQYIYL